MLGSEVWGLEGFKDLGLKSSRAWGSRVFGGN